ncbi:MAG: mechanosensitive ion channel family protein [Bacteroidales bacterium]|nr:mechanosensitive ion channel family protein [Bacteroidales bacterium]
MNTADNYITATIKSLFGLKEYLHGFMTSQGIGEKVIDITTNIITGIFILLLATLTYWLAKIIVERVIHRILIKSKIKWDDAFLETKFFARLAHFVPAFVISAFGSLFFSDNPTVHAFIDTLLALYYIVIAVTVFFSFLEAIYIITQQNKNLSGHPIRGIVQAVKLVILLVAIILIISVLFDKQPLVVLSALGALTAVLMLVFKDTILGFTAGIMLAANKMVRVGDWIEKPSAGADGDVIDISLTTVKVQNWDKTITTIPAYDLISGSFKNWRGMNETGGRRIKRAMHIDVKTIRFADEEMLERWKKIDLIRPYLDEKLKEIAEDKSGRHLTNLGTFRAYCLAYLKSHPKIHQDLTMIVRQLEPKELGIPLELYTFTNDTRWDVYESVQADIFDHLLAIVKEFGLAIYQR